MNNFSFTEKNAIQYKNSGNALLDFFRSAAAMREDSADVNKIINLFIRAFIKNKKIAIKLLFWLRDIRGGAGERKLFNNIIRFIAKYSPEFVINNFETIIKYGYYKDLLNISDIKSIQPELIKFWANKLLQKNDKLLFKWTPRLKSKYFYFAKLLKKELNLSNAEYRKFLKENSKTVEQLMSNREWSKINYSSVPSIAMRNYINSYKRNDGERFLKFINSKNKINTNVLYPYDVIKLLNYDKDEIPDEIIEKLWLNLPNFLNKNHKRILVILDTSGSMLQRNRYFKISPLDIGISLTLYLSEKTSGLFKNKFITFSEFPELITIDENLTLRQKYELIFNTNWGTTTNFESSYKLLLNYAVSNNIKPSEFPEILLVISDLQFDPTTSIDGKNGELFIKNIKKMFKKYGYKLPIIVFWNVAEAYTGSHITSKNKNFVAISGFNPNIVKNIINGEKINPMEVLYKTVEKYNDINFKGLNKFINFIKNNYSEYIYI